MADVRTLIAVSLALNGTQDQVRDFIAAKPPDETQQDDEQTVAEALAAFGLKRVSNG